MEQGKVSDVSGEVVVTDAPEAAEVILPEPGDDGGEFGIARIGD